MKNLQVEAIRIEFRRAAVRRPVARRYHVSLTQWEIDRRTAKFNSKLTERRLVSSAVLGRDDDIPRRDLGHGLEEVRRERTA
jgi:hypothetical protein